MRVALDFNPVLISRFSGFHSYGKGLLKGFNCLVEKPEFVFFYSKRFARELQRIKDKFSQRAQFKSTAIKMRWLEGIWRYSSYPKLESFIGGFDIYHCFHHLMPPTNGKPRLMTVHDLRRYKLPELYKKSKLELFELAVKRADHFIAVSQSTKKDLCSIFGISNEKVVVVHLSSGTTFKSVPEPEKRKIKKQLAKTLGSHLENYLVVFSSPDKRKNISRTIEAFLLAKKHLPDNYKLVIVGNLPKGDESFGSIDFNKAADSIVVAGTVDNVEQILCCAEGLVFASLYEGFGIPILEAFTCGVPVITSNCSSMPEVAGDAALLVNPYDEESISQAMVHICNDVELRTHLINSGTQRCKEFSWQKSAAKTLEVYNELL